MQQISGSAENNLFLGLGKATLRGVKKCPKCGHYNGTKSTVCKNKACNIKLNDHKNKLEIDACKLISGASTRVFSVCSHNGEIDYYDFVQLPYVDKSDVRRTPLEPHNSPALCFVKSCQQAFNANILKCHEKPVSYNSVEQCKHIQAALSCNSEAFPLYNEFPKVHNLCTNKEMKQELLSLISESTAPLVQRVSKKIFVVRCKVNPEQPLGYLHVSLLGDSSEELHFSCQCSYFKTKNVNTNVNNIMQGRRMVEQGRRMMEKCVHYYACICALESNELHQEFIHYINYEKLSFFQMLLKTSSLNNENNEDNFCEPESEDLLTFLEDSSAEVRIRLLNSDLDNKTVSSVNEQLRQLEWMQNVTANFLLSDEKTFIDLGKTFNIQQCDFQANTNFSNSNPIKEKHKCKDEPNEVAVKKKKNNAIKKKYSDGFVPIFPKFNAHPLKSISCAITVNFYQWLASITETINQQMHYKFNGKKQTLIFHTQQIFFDSLLDRISVHGQKRRLPNSTIAFTSTDSIPLGTFTKFTWSITNISHVKNIFDNPLLPLNVTRSFIDNDDGTYGDYDEIDDATPINQLVLRPMEVRTFLKVGKVVPDQAESTPFIIEWIPNVLPITNIGIMKIVFEYGHHPPVKGTVISFK